MVLSIDIGTTFLKLAVVDFKGNIHYSNKKRVEIYRDSDVCEVDPEEWIACIVELCRGIPLVCSSNITVIVLSGNGPTLVPIGVNGKPVHRAILWMDKRSESVRDEIRSLIGDFNPNFFLGKAFWLKKELPEIYSRTFSFFSCPEYVSYLLTGNKRTLLPGEGFKPFYWTDDKIDKLALDKSKFPSYITPLEVYGSYDGVKKLGGISTGIPVVCAGPDFLMSVLGSGSIKSGILCDRTGTSEGLNLCTDYEFKDNDLRTLPHLVDSLFTVAGLIPESGELLLNGRLDVLVDKYKEIVDRMIGLGLHIDEVRIIGGHSQVDKLNMKKSEAFDIPLKVYPPGSELVGNAVLGSVVTGKYRNLEEACNSMIREIKCYNV